MDEHQRIAHYLTPLTANEEGAFGLQNDAACLSVPNNMKLVVTSDGVTAGTHLPSDATAEQLVRKLIRRNISDLAAMGASPWRYSLNLHLTGNESAEWWEQLANTLATEQARYDMVLVGGDCASGASTPHLSMSCYGLSFKTLSRSGASVGERVYVTGTIGDAALYLHTQHPSVAESYYAPEPPIMFAQQLHAIATSCIDISDGLVADAGHIAKASNCAITMDQETIPLSDAAHGLVQQTPEHWQHIISGGDDYQLLFTAPEEKQEALLDMAKLYRLPVTHIGHVTEGEGVQVLDASQNVVPLTQAGYSHS